MNEQPELGPCCGCMSRGNVYNIICLPQRLPEQYCGRGAGWGCLACNTPLDGVTVVMCGRCIENKIEPIACILGGDYEGQVLSLDFPAVYFGHDYHHHPEEFPANTPGRPLVWFRDETDDLCSWCGRWLDPEAHEPPVIMIDGSWTAFLHVDCFGEWYKERGPG